MSPKAKLWLIKDELDSIQIDVDFTLEKEGVRIKAKSPADWLIAKNELIRAGFPVLPQST